MPIKIEVPRKLSAKLILTTESGLTVQWVSIFFGALNKAYQRLCYLEEQQYQLMISHNAVFAPDYRDILLSELRSNAESPFHDLYYSLQLHRVHVSSPGFWEIIGKFNPLETIRLILDDIHRRRQDRKYREAAEEETLRLKNLLLQAEVVQAFIKTLKEGGFEESAVIELVESLLLSPSTELRREATLYISKVVLESEDH